MMWPFYLMALVAIVSTVRVVTNTNPVHALLSLIVSLLAVAGIFMIVGRLLQVLLKSSFMPEQLWFCLSSW